MKFFRYYRPEHALLVLTDLEIRASIPNTLNDPFELSPNIDPSQFTQQRCEAFLREDSNVEMWYQREGRRRGFTGKKAFKRWYLKDLPRRAAALLPKVPANVERVRKAFANDFSEKWRLICGSCIPNSILMWSHYAANHTGLVVEFDLKEPPFSALGKYIFHVTYSEKKPDYVHSNKQRAFQKELFAIATTKAAAWEYEQEIRVILVASRTALRDMQYLPITARSITGVYLGCRASASIRASAQAALNSAHLRHIRLSQAELDPSEYALKFAQIPQE